MQNKQLTATSYVTLLITRQQTKFSKKFKRKECMKETRALILLLQHIIPFGSSIVQTS